MNNPYREWKERRAHNRRSLGPLGPDGPATVTAPAPVPVRSSPFRYSAGALAFGEIPVGWHPDQWRNRLRQLAQRCEWLNNGKAAIYRAWADQIDAALSDARSA